MAERPPLSSFFTSDGSQDSRPPLSSFDASQEKPELGLLDIPGQAVSHLGSSAVQFGKNIVQPILHPVETAENIGRVGLGVGEKLGISPTTGHEQYADAVGQFFKERYGGYENVKQTIATDPVGAVADLATVLTGGEAILGRAPGIIGETARAAGTVGDVVNPLSVTKLAPTGKLKDVGSSVVGNLLTHTGGEGVRETGRALATGGPERAAALEGLRAPEEVQQTIVKRFRSALDDVYLQRSAEYQRRMGGLTSKPLNFNEIDAAIAKVEDVGKLKGQDIAQLAGETEKTAAQQMLDGIKQNVAAWKQLPPEYHNPAGLDALKKHIGEKIDWKTRPDAANKVAQTVYHAVRDTITKQDPVYAEVMKDYQKASDFINDVEKTLSLKKGASQDTTLRKLLSSTRSNVNTNFGRRMDLVKDLNKIDPTLLPSVAGMSMAPYTAQGLGKAVTGGGLLYGLGHGVLNPATLASLAATSPRLWGEVLAAATKAGINPELLRRIALGARAAGTANAAQ